MDLNDIISEREKQNKNSNNILMDIYKDRDKSSDSKCELNKLNGNKINLIRNNNKNKFNNNEHNLHFIDDYYPKNRKKKSNLKKSCCKIIKEKINYFINSLTGLIFMIIIIFLTIIYYDIKCLFFPPSYKLYYINFYILLMIIYLFDFFFRNFIIKEQKKLMYFWLDLISILTMVFDIDDFSYPFIQYILYNNDSKNNKKLNYSKQFYVELVIKSIHILKLLRILKIYKLFSDILKEKDIRIKAKELSSNKSNHIIRSLTIKKSSTNIHDQNTSNFPLNHQATTSPISAKKFANVEKQKSYLDYYNQIKEIDTHKQNKMNRKIIDGISRLMIIVIIFILIIGLYTDEEYSNVKIGYLCISRQINRIRNNCINDCINCENECSKVIENIVNNYLFNNVISNFPVIEIELNNTLYYRNHSLSDSIEKKFHRKDYSYFFNEEDPYVIILASKKKAAKIECIVFLIRVIFLIFLFSFLIFFINKDVYILIFRPLDDVSKILEKVSKDPVNSKKINELIKKSNNETKEKNKFSAYLEIQNIQNTLVRISALMAIGFGEAGGEILKKNITSEEGLNPMLKGSKINAIFGFCYIHDFSEINEAFQEKTFIFINQLSDIVHSCIDKFNGIINKNLGDCFLLAWKYKEEKKDNKKDKKDSIKNSDLINKKSELADCALLGFLNIIKKINKSRVILEYKKDPDIIKKFGNKYSIQMGFGLHTGWGIEGSIGSFYKIDCSYLSPNVNIAARLETANSIYGTDILFSGEIYNLLSDFMKNICRKIDRVTVKGSKKPLDLYTIDINRNIKPGKNISKKDRLSLRERKNYYAIKKKKLWHKYNEELKEEEEPKSISELYFKQSNGLKQLLKKYKSEMFYNLFNEGFNKYIDGDWEIAFEKLKKAKYLEKNDGPTNTIYKYLLQNKLKSPPNWPGYRELTSKT